MRIVIDIQTTLGQKTGFGFYVQNLIENLQKYDQKNEYIFIKPTRTERDLSTPARFIWDQLRFPLKAKKAKAELLHQPCFSVPIFYKGKTVVTCHDLVARLFPQNLPLASRLFFSKWMPFTYRKADKIIAISENTKKDLIEILQIPKGKIEVIYSAVSDYFRPINDRNKIEKILSQYKIPKPYLLHVGTLEPRKNLEFLVEVFSKVILENPNLYLVIVGKKGWYYEGLFHLVKKLKLAQKVFFPGYIREQDLPYIYAAASLFVFPSIYEGFGLPPLEAMATGCPVVSSNTSSMPEIVGQAGILLPLNEIHLWVKKILEILQNPHLSQKLKAQGLKQAQKFSWAKTAQKTIEVYEKVFHYHS